ncbi:uncharacterized protein KD926_004846 [Aspergillus affinis]|uniref:uncharacterized protein n=1 Tax=Aspergillus affinis TaxID=1070780 RepID=UPI0022FE41EF|nr:uncharacterized protein KD926_004846 [Aspergillus affinis]KAI9034991.1 hypothetical protein KD926_004846 [Aspergillus affinis]
MAFKAVVMYPNEPDATFDNTYYKEKHMPLVERIWGKYGLTTWHIQKYTTALDGTPSKYSITTTLEWKSEDAVQEALKDPESPLIFQDIPKFTNTQPITLLGGPL